MRDLATAALLILVSHSTAYAQQSNATITINSAAANLIANPAGSREIGLKEKLAALCDAQSRCSRKGSELVDDPNFLIEVIYTCRDTSGTARQKGPLHIKGDETLNLSCLD